MYRVQCRRFDAGGDSKRRVGASAHRQTGADSPMLDGEL